MRAARSSDASKLTHIVRESSAYSGEYRKMVERVTITPEQIARDTIFVYELDGEIAGFYSLKEHADEKEIELDFLFVANEYLGAGIGRRLFQHLLDEARRLGYSSVMIVAHPPAEAFYVKMGAAKVGVVPPRDHVTWERAKMRVVISASEG